jgi:NaMN:DMB phosphoribosyltransferase
LLRSASTRIDVILDGYWSSAAASNARHGVVRVQLRSVSPGR